MAEAKTQAVGAVGAVLLTVGGVAAAIGIYEAQEHHSAVGWFTCCAACIIAAIIIPIIAFVFLPWIEYLGAKQAGALRAPAVAPENKVSPKKENSPHPTPVLSGDRTVVNVTPRFLAKNYQGYKTDIEAEAALQRYLGKWMQVNGILDNMFYGGGPKGKETLFVRLIEEDTPTRNPRNINAALKRLEGISTTLIFTDQRWIDRITTFNHGDSITAIGKLDSIDSGGVKLENCELVEKS